MSALRAPESANPPQNMHSSLIFNGVLICSITLGIFFLRGQQRRREKDEMHAAGNSDGSAARGISQGASRGVGKGKAVGDLARGEQSARSGIWRFFRLPVRLRRGS